MAFENHMVIPGGFATIDATVAGKGITEEGTFTAKVDYVAPVDVDVIQFGVLVGVALGNTITTATGPALVRVSGTDGTTTVLEVLKLSNNSQGLYQGNGTKPGTTLAATTTAFAAGEVILKRMTGSHAFKAGDIIRMGNSTTAGSATGDLVPFVICRVTGSSGRNDNVFQEGVSTQSLL
jgi:hypothetical protein